MMKPNTLQRLLLSTYRGGQFAHLQRGEDLRTCGDALFIALYNELGDEVILDARRRGMDAGQLAVQRLNGMIAEIGYVVGYINANVQAVPPAQSRATMPR